MNKDSLKHLFDNPRVCFGQTIMMPALHTSNEHKSPLVQYERVYTPR